MHTERISSILQKDCRFDKRQPLLVGVSGGPDSLCLLGVLQELGYPLVVAHYDHRLRPDSGADAERVRAVAEGRGLAFVLGAGDVREMAQAGRQSIEEAARVARYRFLFQAAREAQAQAVAVAHTADDQVETVLMHLLRGSGLGGLKGMLPCSSLAEFDPQIPLVRPLLETWRDETLEYCRENGLEPIFDPSNADTTFFRNRLRHELIPNLQSYNPQVKPVLLRMASVLSGDYAQLQASAGQAFTAGLRERGAGFLAFDLDAMRAYPPGLARTVIRQAVGELRPGLRDIDFASIERALEFIQSPPAARHIDLIDRLDLEVEDGRLLLRERAACLPGSGWPQLAPSEELSLSIPGEIRLANGWRLSASIQLVDPVALPDWDHAADPYQAWLDAGPAGPELPALRIRARRPGDRFLPHGLAGHAVKLSDYFINLKLPRRARAAWPLVFINEELAWVPGYRSSEAFRVGLKAGRVLHLRLEET
jgi:tRNA(Ile)-lysidine synthase